MRRQGGYSLWMAQADEGGRAVLRVAHSGMRQRLRDDGKTRVGCRGKSECVCVRLYKIRAQGRRPVPARDGKACAVILWEVRMRCVSVCELEWRHGRASAVGGLGVRSGMISVVAVVLCGVVNGRVVRVRHWCCAVL
jgi:hypothetical protein